MPLPLIWLVGAVAVSAVKKGADARTLLKSASELQALSNEKKVAAETNFESRLLEVRTAALELEEQKLAVMARTMASFVELWERQKKKANVSDKDFTLKLNISPEKLEEFKSVGVRSLDVAKGLMQAGMAGVSTGAGVMTAVGALGAASTGTAITALSGAAANSALFAWLGGGSLAAGGGGMALGAVVAGGLFVAPAALVGAFIIAKKGEEAQTAAAKYAAQVDVYNAQLALKCTTLKGVERRMEEITGLIRQLVVRLRKALAVCEADEAVMNGNVDLEHFFIAASLAKALSDLLSVPIIDAGLEATFSSMKAVTATERLLRENPVTS
jgi:hypothetical protein